MPSIETLARLVAEVGVTFDAVFSTSTSPCEARGAAPDDRLRRRLDQLVERMSPRAARALVAVAAELARAARSR